MEDWHLGVEGWQLEVEKVGLGVQGKHPVVEDLHLRLDLRVEG